MIEEHLSLPFATTVLGVPVTVERVQLTLRDEIVAVCRRARTRQTVPLLDLPLPSPPPAGSEWIAAYRHWLQGGSRERPYDDGFTDGGFLRYRYHGTDPNHRDNVGLRTAMQRQTPLIYLRGIVQGLYEPAWPVFIVEDHPEALTFIVAIDDQVGAPAAWQVNDPGSFFDPWRALSNTRIQSRIAGWPPHESACSLFPRT